MNLLSRSEEIILVAILKLEDKAYGLSIRNQIFEDTGDKWSFASIYQPLGRLVKKKYISRSQGEPTPGRGGRNRYYYALTRQGRRALLEIKTAHECVWRGAPRIAVD